jgi:chloramphenicol O-acetyltransferase type A
MKEWGWHRVDSPHWPRWGHYKFFRDYEHPHFSITAMVDVSRTYHVTKQHGLSFFTACLYQVVHVANRIPAFRQRIIEGEVREYERVHPGFTVLPEGELYSNCHVEYDPDPVNFFRNVEEGIAQVKAHPGMGGGCGRHDLLYISCLPWITFTGMTNPYKHPASDTVPRLTWGRFTEKDGRREMPVSIEMHHALADGIHAGQFFNGLQDGFNQPEQDLAGLLREG